MNIRVRFIVSLVVVMLLAVHLRGAAAVATAKADSHVPADQAQSRAVFLVANKHDDTLTFIDPNRLEIITTIPTGPNPHEMVVTPDQRFAYFSNYAPPGNTISVVDLVHKKHILQIPTGKFARIHGAAMAPDGKRAYFTAGQTGFVVEVDTATNKVTRGIATHGKISHMVLVSRDGKWLYTANIESRNVSVIERASGRLVTQMPCGKGCEGMAFTPDGKYLWAANQTGGTITIIDLATNRPVETFPCPGMPVRMRFTDDGKRVLVASWTKVGQLVVLNATTHEEIKRIKVGGFAIGVEISPDGRRAFVGCEHGDGLHVIDMATLTVVKVLKTGNGPDPMAWWYPPLGGSSYRRQTVEDAGKRLAQVPSPPTSEGRGEGRILRCPEVFGGQNVGWTVPARIATPLGI